MNPHHITHHVEQDHRNPDVLLHRATCTCGKELIGTSHRDLMHDVADNMADILSQHVPAPPDLRDHHTTVDYLPWNDEYMADCLCGWRQVVDTFTQAEDANTAHIAELGDRITQEWENQFGGKDVRDTIRDAARARSAALPPIHSYGPGEAKPLTAWEPPTRTPGGV